MMRRCSRYLCASAAEGLCFDLSPGQQSYQDAARKFAREVIAPQAAELDRTMAYPEDIFKQAWTAGLLNVHIPTACGGMGAGCLDGVLISEQFAWACTGVSTALEANHLASAPVILAGSPELQKKYLRRLIDEPLKASYCVTEPGAGSDVAGIKTSAKRKGDDWVINGEKMWITGGGVANWFFVLTRATEEEGKPFVAFVVDGDAQGVTRGRKEINLGQRCSDTRGIRFDNVVVSASNMVGGIGDGFKIAMKAFDFTRPPVAIGAVGLAQRCLDESRTYAQTRKTMGKPIAEHQAVAFMIADMAVGIEAARLMTYKSAAILDRGMRNTTIASCAKLFASETAQKCATDAVQVFGGNGFNSEYPVEKLYRDCKIFSIYEGTSQIQRLIISRAVLGEK